MSTQGIQGSGLTREETSASRDARIMAKLAVGRAAFLKLKAMDPEWAIGCRHSVLSNTDQLLPARRPTFDAQTTKFLDDSIARAARR